MVIALTGGFLVWLGETIFAHARCPHTNLFQLMLLKCGAVHPGGEALGAEIVAVGVGVMLLTFTRAIKGR